MAIAFDSIAINSSSFTVPTSNPILFVGYTGSIGVDDVTSISYGGQSMILVDKVLNPGTNGRFEYLWVLQAPPTGSNSFQVNGSNASVSSAIAYTGASQSGQVDAHNKATGGNGTTSLAVAVTTIANNCWVTGYWNSNNGNKSTAGTGTTNRDTSDTQGFMDNNSAKTPAGSVTLNQNNAGAGLVWISASFKPAVPNTNNFLMFM